MVDIFHTSSHFYQINFKFSTVCKQSGKLCRTRSTDLDLNCFQSRIVVMGGTLGTGTFKPEKNLVFFFRIKKSRSP